MVWHGKEGMISLTACSPFPEVFLRKKEDDIRIYMQELSQQQYNEDDVIAELQTMISDISRTRQSIPQVVQLQRLSFLNRDALDRGRGPLALRRGMYHGNVTSPYNYSPNSSPEDNSTLV